MALIVVPNSGQSLNSSRPNVNNNFSVIDTAFAVDHVDYNTSGQGKHNQVTFPVQAMMPTYASGEDAFYNFMNTTTTQNELYIHKQNSAGTSDIPLTASILSQSTPAIASSGWTMVPSGILMRWENLSGNGLTTVNLSSGYINFTTIYSVILTVVDPSGADVNVAVRLVNIISATQFRVYFSSRTSSGAAAGSAKALIIGS